MTGPGDRGSVATRLWARLQVLTFRGVTSLVDAGSPALRFGIGHAVRRRLLERSLPSLTAVGAVAAVPGQQREAYADQPLVVLVTRTLGTGGVEAIVATLAQGLPAHGLNCVVLCELGGSTADALRARGVAVIEARDARAADAMLAAAGTIVAAQLHNAPDYLIAACAKRDIPIVPVVHTTDINFSDDDWMRQSELFHRSATVIAVSETVKAFVEFHLPSPTAAPIAVVPNGVTARVGLDPAHARLRLGDALGVEIADSAVVTCLARYDMQKNIPGLVRAFLDAADHDLDALLVIAGPVGDWIEYAHADAIRRAHPRAGRIHLLGSSSTPDLLDAADAFVLDSFFEGWPVAASEAVMAGLPVVISDVGGAQELVGDSGERGIICDNPGGAPATITLAQIGEARRRASQSNSAALTAALRNVITDIPRWRARREELALEAAEWLGADTMVLAHARLLGAVRIVAKDAT